MCLDEVLADDGRGPEPQECGHDVEGANQDHCPNHAMTRRLCIGNRVEPDQDVRQASRTKDQSDAQRNQVERSVWRFVTKARGEEVLHYFLALGIVIGHVANGIEEGTETESEV